MRRDPSHALPEARRQSDRADRPDDAKRFGSWRKPAREEKVVHAHRVQREQVGQDQKLRLVERETCVAEAFGDAAARVDEDEGFTKGDCSGGTAALRIFVLVSGSDRDRFEFDSGIAINRCNDLRHLGGTPEHAGANPRQHEDRETESEKEKLAVHLRGMQLLSMVLQ